MTNAEFLAVEHTAQRRIYDQLLERVKVHVTGCWLYDGHRSHGYGQMRVEGAQRPAAELMWEAKRGPIPEGKEVKQRCCVRNCVQPRHLYLATKQEFAE